MFPKYFGSTHPMKHRKRRQVWRAKQIRNDSLTFSVSEKGTSNKTAKLYDEGRCRHGPLTCLP